MKDLLEGNSIAHPSPDTNEILSKCQTLINSGVISIKVTREAKEKIINGDWGDIVSISARRFSPYPTRVTDVGVILDIGIHDIDLIRYLFAKEVGYLTKSVLENIENNNFVFVNI